MCRYLLSLLLLVYLAGCAGNGDETTSTALSTATVQALDTTVDTELGAANLPSAVVGIWIGGKPAYLATRGPDQLGYPSPRSVDAPFRIASITKTFTGTSILLLVDDGKLKLTDPLSTWYPDFPNATKIRVVDLLRMRSGIPDSIGEAFVAEYYANPLTTLGAEDMIARAAATPIAQFAAPDTATVYTNVNFALLERIVEKASGANIRSFLQVRIFGPLGMNHTVYPTGPVLASPLHGYSFEPATGTFADRTLLNPAPAGGAGAIVSTLDDLQKYARTLCGGGLLKPDTQTRRLVTTAFEGETALVGYGLGVARIGRFCGHNGTIFGFSSEMWYLPERDAVIVVNVNRLDLDDQSRSVELFAKVAKVAFPDLVDW